ncbi:hypothetical protein PG996_012630 [Apiospora saccharicola]|uniref:FAD/NAD(P)-binding domain-containing protein n=1 Tax=Apiospora saccharicola TaxID=335842 RepID=A0ABR1U5X8_9PEZI
MTSPTEITDAIIVGGSHAGLSAALTLYRANYTSLIFDFGTPRNAHADHVHMVPGWADKSPNDLRGKSHDELLKTGLVKIVERRLVVSAAKLEDGTFEVVDDKGDHWKGRKMVLAYGVEEKHPDIPGYTDNYGKLIYHCLFCYGYEKRGAEVAGVLATGPTVPSTGPCPTSSGARWTPRPASKSSIHDGGGDGDVPDGSKVAEERVQSRRCPRRFLTRQVGLDGGEHRREPGPSLSLNAQKIPYHSQKIMADQDEDHTMFYIRTSLCPQLEPTSDGFFRCSLQWNKGWGFSASTGEVSGKAFGFVGSE